MIDVASRRERWLLAAALLLYFGLTLWLTLHHEAWRDEADTWLIMRDGGVRVMLSHTSEVGNPALWYLLQAPFASTGFPYMAQQLIALFLAWFAAVVFVIDAPFRPGLKILFLFSYYAAFEYSVVARPYPLLYALLFAIAAVWRRRERAPLLLAILSALLANTLAHGLMISFALGLIYGVEVIRKRTGRAIAALFIMLTGGILSFIQLVPRQWPQHHRYVDPGTVPWAIGEAFLPEVDPRISFAAGLVVLLLVVLAIGDRTGVLLFMTLSVIALLLIFVYVWAAGLRHTGLILLVVMASLWMAGGGDNPQRIRAKRWLEGALAICFAVGIVATAKAAIADTKFAFSGSREMADYIAAHVPASTTIVAETPILSEAVLPYLPGRQFWYPERQAPGSYMLWPDLFGPVNKPRPPPAFEVARRHLGSRGWLLLASARLSPVDEEGFSLLATNRRKVYAHPEEQYWLYAPRVSGE